MTKKITATIIAATMVLSMAGPVMGTTVEELQAQIIELQTLVATLTAQLAAPVAPTVPATGVPASCVGVTFATNLTVGSTGADVKCLQALLNTDSATQVAATGVGSLGNETLYFGSLTGAAVVKFQNKYASEVLTPIGLTAGTGFVGAQTRAKLNALLTALPTAPAPTDPTVPTVPGEVEVGEGYLTFKLLGIPSDVTEVKGGESNVAVMSFELKAYDSDVVVRRLDLHSDAATVTRPAANLTHVTLYDGANALVGVDANTFARPTGQTYFRYRFEGLNLSIPKGTTKTITVKVSAIETPTNNAEYRFTIPVSGIRYTDTLGLNHNLLTSAERRIFTMKSTVTGALVASLNAGTPDAGVTLVSETLVTEDVELLKFDLKATQQTVGVDTIPVTLYKDAATTNVGTVVAAVKLYDGSTLLGVETLTAGVATFSNLNLIVAKDTTKTLTVKVNLYKLDAGTTYAAGSYVHAVVTGNASMYAEDVNYATVVPSGSATGKNRYLYVVAPHVALDSTKITKLDDAGKIYQFEIKFKVTAVGDDVYIASNAVASSTAQNNNFVVFYATENATSGTAVHLSSTATKESAGVTYYRVAKETTETFTAVFTVNNSASGSPAGYYSAHIVNIAWNTSNANPGSTGLTGWAVEDLKTSIQYILGTT